MGRHELGARIVEGRRGLSFSGRGVFGKLGVGCAEAVVCLSRA